jgi:HK97 family phage prohead protease
MSELEIEIRTKQHGVEVLDVSFPERLIEIVVMPYETEARVVHRGQWIREICSRGAFQAVNPAKRRITVNRGHDINAVVGKAVALHPSREEGLVAELRISETELGNDTLRLAADGILDASAGFGVMDGGESWPERSLRRLSRLWLDHIALTPDPAYQGTGVLSVRDADRDGAVGPPLLRPNLEVVRGWQLADRYAMIDPTT